MPAGRIATAIYTEQLGAVFRQMPIALTVNIVNGALTAIILSLLAAGSLPKIWFLARGLGDRGPLGPVVAVSSR